MKWTIGDNGKVREWLIYDRSTDEMYCSDCRMYGSEKAKSNPLVIGTKNLKLEAIKDHESSKSHLHTISCKISKTALPEETSCGQGTDVHEKDFKKYSLRVIITYNDFVNNLTALKCVFLQVKE